MRFRRWFIGLFMLIAAFFGWQVYSADANLTWVNATTNTDDSPYDDPGGSRVYRAQSPGGAMALIATLPPVDTSYTDTTAIEGANCYVVTHFDDDGNESDFSNEACKDVDTLAPNPPVIAVN